MKRKPMPLTSVRGRIRHFIEKHAHCLGDDVLEVGSRKTNPKAWWIENRDLARGEWLGIDMQPGIGVDQVVDIHDMPADWAGRFSGVLCSEVLEHVARPWVALPKVREVIRPGGHIIVTTLFAFPVHGYPSDFYRYTDAGLRLLLEDAGFVDVRTEYAGEIHTTLDDHGEGRIHRRVLPMHIFATARVPEPEEPAVSGEDW